MGEYGRLRPWVLAAAGIALLVLAWVFGNPPGAAPDERGHFVRALGAGDFELAGRPFVPTEAQKRAFRAQGASGQAPIAGSNLATLLWTAEQTRTFAVPRSLSVTAFGCNDRRPEASAACLDAPPAGERSSRTPSYTGTYPPFLYVLPGAAMRAAGTPDASLRLGRLVSALLSVALLVAAAWLALSAAGGWAAFSGLALAVTPMVVFCASSLNASGPEIAAGVCFVAAGLRLLGGGAPRGAWTALAAAGAVLAVARSLGPVLLAVLVGVLALLDGPRPAWRALAVRPRASVGAGVKLALALAVGVYWELSQQPTGVPGAVGLRIALAQSVHDLDDVARHAVGTFGALDTPLPPVLYVLWGLAVLGLTGLALWLGSARERVGVAICAAAGVGVTVAASVLQLRHGYGIQGRHVLPVLVAAPLWSAEVVRRHRERLGPRDRALLVVGAGALFAGGQALAFWVDARRAAVGTGGPWLFVGSAQWSPPGGWWPWIAVAAVGCALVLAAALAQRSSRSRSRSMPRSATIAPR